MSEIFRRIQSIADIPIGKEVIHPIICDQHHCSTTTLLLDDGTKQFLCFGSGKVQTVADLETLNPDDPQAAHIIQLENATRLIMPQSLLGTALARDGIEHSYGPGIQVSHSLSAAEWSWLLPKLKQLWREYPPDTGSHLR